MNTSNVVTTLPASVNPLIATFYSFKGGVGRTLALVNVAFELATRGKRVVLIDFDLEAPGLDAFSPLKPPQPVQGLLEYLEAYIATGSPPEIAPYLHTISSPHVRGSITLIYAGRFDSHYAERLGRINWLDLYEKRDGYMLFEYLKEQLKKELRPDYILIDSRTGESDIAGIATIHLPDVVVLMYALDDQNLRGAEAMASVIRKNVVGRRIKILPVASRVPFDPSYLTRQQERLTEAAARGLEPTVVIPAHPSLAFGDAVVMNALERKAVNLVPSPIRDSIESLARQLIQAKVDDEDNILEAAHSAFAQGNNSLALELYTKAVQTHQSSRSLFQFGNFLLRTGKHEASAEAFQLARKVDPDWPEPLIKLAQTSLALGRVDEARTHVLMYLESPKLDYEALFGTLDGFYRSRQLEVAEMIASRCDESDELPTRLSARHDLCRLLLATGRADEAVALFERTFPLEPQVLRELPWRFNYAEALLRTGRPEAHEHFRLFINQMEQQMAQFPADAILPNTLESAIRQLQSNLNLMIYLRTSNALQAWGHALKVVGETRRARKQLQRAIEVAEKTPADTLIFSACTYLWERPDAFIQQTESEISTLGD